MLTGKSRLTRFAGSAAGAIEKATPIVHEIILAIAGRTQVIDPPSRDVVAVLTSGQKMEEFTQDEVTLMAEEKPEYTALCTNVGFDFEGTKIAQKTVDLDWGGGFLITFVSRCLLILLDPER